jgi:hypothetical protein
MTVRELRASGLESLALTTELLQRVRLADPTAGVWEAADLQWWWRTPRSSDTVEQLFWADDVGPVAAVVLTDWGMTWGFDPIVVPGVAAVTVSKLYTRSGFRPTSMTTPYRWTRPPTEQPAELPGPSPDTGLS